MRKKMLVVLVAAIAASGATLYASREAVYQAVGAYLTVEDPLRRVDVIQVISGPDHRADYAIDLFKRGYGDVIFFTGGWCDTIQGIHAERGRQRALAQGIPAAAIVADATQVTSTYAEAERLKVYLDQRATPVKSVMLVSDSYHMRRARWAYRQVLGDEIELLMAPVPFERSPFAQRWWEDPLSAQMVKEEYLKFAYYVARYQLSFGPVRDWLATLDRD